MKILKFGGSSVGSPARIKKVCEIIGNLKKENGQLAVVVSAFQGVTDQLIEMSSLAAQCNDQYRELFKELENKHLDFAKELINVQNQSPILAEIKSQLNELEDALRGIFLIKELSPKIKDFITSFGERLSAYIISQSLKEFDVQADFLDARNLIKTDDTFVNAKVDLETSYQNIKAHFAAHENLQLVTGFIASTAGGETTTLGRGGSDYTASLLGAALNASEIQLWTDVDGVLTADPKKVPEAFPVACLSYEEAMELSHFGAKVIYSPTIQPVLGQKIPIRIKNTFNPQSPGTIIAAECPVNGRSIKGISSITDIALLRIEGTGLVGVIGFASRLFDALAKKNTNAILITQASSEHSICVAVNPEWAPEAKEAIDKEFKLEIQAKQVDEVDIENDLSILAIVGKNMKKHTGISGKLFQALGKNNINVVAIAQGSSELNISVVINQKDESKALNAVHDAFFSTNKKVLPLFLVGPGLVGKTLLKQIEEQKKSSTDIQLAGLANSRKMFFDPAGIPLGEWPDKLQASEEQMNMPAFIEKMKELALENSVFVDCTASEEVSKYYEEILKAGISIATPNKKANSSNWDNYLKLREATQASGAKFFYEANVGAGLPVIGTLKDLLKSGDEIIKIEGVFSGTLSYIFNSFKEGKKFSEIVLEAKEKGYTEPDPRDDLNGLDVARKLLILGREIGLKLELEDIEIESLVPESCRQTESIEAFFEELKKYDDEFAKKQAEAAEEGKSLRYVGQLEDGQGKVFLQKVDASHPCCALAGSDNMIVFTTKRYKENPLVIRGPGAGAEVTAAGVFADILKTVD